MHAGPAPLGASAALQGCSCPKEIGKTGVKGAQQDSVLASHAVLLC